MTAGVQPVGAPTARARLPRSVHVLTGILAVAAVALTYVAELVAPPRDPVPPLALLGLLVALVIAGSLNLEYYYRGHIDAFDHFEAVLVPALYLLLPRSRRR